MNAEAQLAYEARVRNRQAIVAIAAGVLLVAASAVQLGGAHTKVDELTIDLIVANKRFPLDLIASVLNGLGSLLVAWTLSYLYRASAARSPDVRPYVRWIAVVGGVLAAITGVDLRDHRGRQGARVRDHGRPDLRRGQSPRPAPRVCSSFSSWGRRRH